MATPQSVQSSKPVTAAVLLCVTLCVATPSAAQKPGAPARITQAIDSRDLVTLKGNTHPLARPEYDRGVAPDSLPVDRMVLVLRRAPEQESALRQLLEEQQTKSSSKYQKWLSPEEFGQQFGPADADLQTIASWLGANGLQVNRIAAGGTFIEFSGTAAQVQQTFHTRLHKFAMNGREHWANASDPQIPVALAPVVAGVSSLNNFPRKRFSRGLGMFERSNDTGQITSLLTGSGGSFYAVGPTDFATIYDVQGLWNSGIDGTGQSVAIVGETNINMQDVRDFRTFFGLPANDPQIIVNGPDPGITSKDEETEADLDVQWSGAVARNAKIKLVVSASTVATAGVDLSALYIVDNNLAPVMSESYGSCEVALGSAGNLFYQLLWEQAAAQGITVLVSSGDGGSAGCDDFNTATSATSGLAVSGLASTPFNVAVGGTDFDQTPSTAPLFWNSSNDPSTLGSAKSYIPETTWNQSCARTGLAGCGSGADNIVAGSGGSSGVHSRPSWQTGQGVPAGSWRELPDVSLFASDGFSGSFYVVCQADKVTSGTSCSRTSGTTYFRGVGGTSASAPAFAGIMALVNHYQVNQGRSSRQGNANYVLYALAAQSGASCYSSTYPQPSTCVFHDITKGNNSVPCAGGSPNCSVSSGAGSGVLVDPANSSAPGWSTNAGYDRATGLGSVSALRLANRWSSVRFNPTTTTITNLSPTTITHGQSVDVSVSVASQSGIGTPSGDVSLLAGSNSGAPGVEAFTLSNGVASGATRLLPGGTYSVTAHYQGDGAFAASDSNPITVTVDEESSQTLIRLATPGATGPIYSATSVPYGSPYFLRVDVGSPSGIAAIDTNGFACVLGEYACATGTVTLTDNGAPLDGGTFILTALGYFEDLIIQLTGGSHSVHAQYGGDNSFAAGSTSQTITITKAATSMTTPVVCNGYVPPTMGDPEGICVKVLTSSNGAAPTGTVAIYDNGNAIPAAVNYYYTPGSSTQTAQLQAGITYAFPAPGPQVVTAAYGGDTNYSSATSSEWKFMVLGATTTSLTSSLNPSGLGAYTTFTAVVNTNGRFSPTGSVTFMDGPTVLGSAALSWQYLNLSATFTTSALALGQHSITAVYGGDSHNATSSSAALSQTVQPSVATATTLTSGLNPSSWGANVVFTARVTAKDGSQPTGMVVFKDSATTLGTVTLTSSEFATFTTSTLAAGQHSITAVYLGDANQAASTSPTLTQTVQQAETSTVLTSSANPVVWGTYFTFTATVKLQNGSSSTPSGTVTFRDDTVVLETVYVYGGIATYSTSTGLAAGSHAITASYNGSTNALSSVSDTLSQTIRQATTTTQLTSSYTKVTVGTSVDLWVRVIGDFVTGTVTFYDGTTVLGTGSITSPYSTKFSTSTLAAGVHSITAVYPGDSNHLGSTSAALTQIITDFTLPATPPSTTVVAGQVGSATFAVTPLYGFTGSVDFTCVVPATMRLATCSAGSIGITGSSAVNATLVVTTVAPRTSAVFPTGPTWFASTGVFAGIVLLGIPVRKRRWQIIFELVIIAVLVGAIASCGGGGGGSHITYPGTDPGTYTVTVTASSGAAQHTMTANVAVQ